MLCSRGIEIHGKFNVTIKYLSVFYLLYLVDKSWGSSWWGRSLSCALRIPYIVPIHQVIYSLLIYSNLSINCGLYLIFRVLYNYTIKISVSILSTLYSIKYMTLIDLIPSWGAYSWCIHWTNKVLPVQEHRYILLVPIYYINYSFLLLILQFLPEYSFIFILLGMRMKTLSQNLWFNIHSC